MADPSPYELTAWRDIQRFKGRPLSRVMGNASRQVTIGAAELSKRATKHLDNYPRAQLAVSQGQEAVAKGARAAGTGARKTAGALPEGMTGWSGAALESVRRTAGRVARAGLSPKRVVARHQKRGHDVASLSDLRRLDLEQIDAVRGRGASWYYPAVAAAMADISRLTQALVRGKTWTVLDKSAVAIVSKQFARAFGVRFTKQSLGKVVPAAGILLGGAFNWRTLEAIIDAADIAYRRRFLLEKYPHLADEETHGSFPGARPDGPDDADEVISVLEELTEAGGPNLH